MQEKKYRLLGEDSHWVEEKVKRKKKKRPPRILALAVNT